MRLDATQQVRAMQGWHERSGRSTTPSPRQARHAGFRNEAPGIRLDGRNGLLVGLLLLANLRTSLAETMPRPASPFRPGAPPAAGTSHPDAALIPGAGASDYRPVGQTASPPMAAALSSIANGVVGLCTASPRRCATAVGVGTLLAGAVVLKAAVDSAQVQQPVATPALQTAQEDRLLDAIEGIAIPQDTPADSPPDLQDALLDIARRCAGDRQCRADAINVLLRKLPEATLSMIQGMLDATAGVTSTHFPPGAEAFPFGHDAVDTLASLLADIYTPEVASYQDDLEAIVAAGRDAGGDEAAANRGRLQAVHALLERDGHHVEARGFRATDRLRPELVHEGINLLVSPTARETDVPASRRLLLVAHGDVAGLASGSDGAYDNASGVAAVLHVLRLLDPRTFADGTRVQALITSLEERHLLGSSAFVEQCMQQQDCPTLVVNIDMVGRGGHNYLLSGSDTLAGHYYVGKAPMNLAAPVPNPAETAASGHLQARFNADGFVRQPAGEPLLLTSDNLSFQNASIPTLGLAQMSATDATALRDIQQARIEYERALNSVDWSRYGDHHEGRITLATEELARYREAQASGDQAWERYQALRRHWKHSSGQIVHKGGDRLYRVNPRMAVDFSNALAGFVRGWSGSAPATAAVTSPSTAT